MTTTRTYAKLMDEEDSAELMDDTSSDSSSESSSARAKTPSSSISRYCCSHIRRSAASASRPRLRSKPSTESTADSLESTELMERLESKELMERLAPEACLRRFASRKCCTFMVGVGGGFEIVRHLWWLRMFGGSSSLWNLKFDSCVGLSTTVQQYNGTKNDSPQVSVAHGPPPSSPTNY